MRFTQCTVVFLIITELSEYSLQNRRDSFAYFRREEASASHARREGRVLVLAPSGFSPGTPVFPSPQKPTFPNFNLI